MQTFSKDGIFHLQAVALVYACFLCRKRHEGHHPFRPVTVEGGNAVPSSILYAITSATAKPFIQFSSDTAKLSVSLRRGRVKRGVGSFRRRIQIGVAAIV